MSEEIKRNDNVFVYDPKHQSVFECKVQDIFIKEDGMKVYKLVPSINLNLDPVYFSERRVFKEFKDAFNEAMDL